MPDIYETLEVRKVLAETLLDVHSEVNSARLESLVMIDGYDALKDELAATGEMLALVAERGSLPLSSSFDLRPYVERAEKGGILTARDLDRVALDARLAGKLREHLARLKTEDAPHLVELRDSLVDLFPLETAIRKVVLPSLEISDDASPTLSRIRRKLSALEKEIRRKADELLITYREFLSEEAVTIRNGHFVLPVVAANKGRVPGVLHDFSETRQTAFIEPSALVEMSNESLLLKDEEEEEIKRLLKLLSERLIKDKDAIIGNNDVIARLDFLHAKALFGIRHEAIIAELTKERVIEAEGARHPLIPKEAVIPNDFRFNDKLRIIVISGPNAGGKTIAIKTLGLLVVLNQLGFPVPTRTRARLSYFPNVHADIGDNQSLSDNLSTFAAHVENLAGIARSLGPDDLALLDELGTGTSPREGEALAVAMSEFLRESGAFALISSHFEGLKEYAFNHPGVSNAMMAFDDEKLAPTYKLRIGLPGKSYGLVMARAYDLPASIVDAAEKGLGKDARGEVDDILDRLSAALRAEEKRNNDLSVKEKALAEKEKLLAEREGNLAKRRVSLLADVKDEKRKLVEEARSQIDEALEVLRHPDAKEHELIAAKTKVKRILEAGEEEKEETPVVINEKIEVGSYVRVKGLGLVGRVSKLSGKRVGLITPDSLAASARLDQLEAIAPPRRSEPTKAVTPLIAGIKNVPREINVIGLRVEEALPLVEKYLDDALLSHRSEVRIVHGMGTGRLREAIRGYLSTLGFVKEYRYGERSEGGEGATIVTLR